MKNAHVFIIQNFEILEISETYSSRQAATAGEMINRPRKKHTTRVKKVYKRASSG